MSATELSNRLQALCGLAASEFVLHREDMLLLDWLVRTESDYTLCEWEVREGRGFVVPGVGVPAYIGIEHMAQCIAIHAGARARVNRLRPPLGFLLGARHYKTTVDYFQIGTTYQVECKELVRDEQGMGSYECHITLDGNNLATGRLVVLEKQAGKRIDGPIA